MVLRDLLVGIPVVGLFGGGALAVVGGLVVLFRLRYYNRDLWEDLGRPWFFKVNPFRSQARAREFFLEGGYRRCSDLWVRRLVPLANIGVWSAAVSMILLVVLGAFGIRTI